MIYVKVYVENYKLICRYIFFKIGRFVNEPTAHQLPNNEYLAILIFISNGSLFLFATRIFEPKKYLSNTDFFSHSIFHTRI